MGPHRQVGGLTAALLLLASSTPLLNACAPLQPPALAVPMRPLTGRTTAGLLHTPAIDGPDLWLGGPDTSRLLAVDASGTRALLTDDSRVALYDARRRGVTRLLPPSGRLIHRAIFAGSGAFALLAERESTLTPGLEHLRLLDLQSGRPLLDLPLPCGCLLGLGASTHHLHAVLSSDDLEGTWVLSWDHAGTLLASQRLTSQVLLPGRDSLTFSRDGARLVALLRDPDGAPLARWIDLRPDLPDPPPPHTLALASPPPPACADARPPCGAAGYVEPDGKTVWWAAADPDGHATLHRIDLASGERLASLTEDNLHPVAWLLASDDTPLLLAQRSLPNLDERRLTYARPLPDRLEHLSEPPDASLPLPGPLEAEPERLGAAAIPAWRHALHLAIDTRPRLTPGNAPRLFIDDATGLASLTSLGGGWRLPPDAPPTPLPPLTAPPLRVFEARFPLEIPDLRATATSFLLTLSLTRRPPGWTGPDTLYTWTPPVGLLLDVLPTGREPGELAALVGGASATTRVMLLKPPTTPTESWLAYRTLWPPDATREAALTTWADPEPHLLALRVADDPPRLELHLLDPSTLTPLPPSTRNLPALPDTFTVTPGLPELVLATRHTLWLASLDQPQAPLLAWTPTPDAWIKDAHPLGGGRVLARLASADRPSAEWWLWLDLTTSPPRVLGHRRLHDVLAVATWPAGRHILALEASGVLTRFAWDDDAGVAVLQRLVLSSADGAWLAFDHRGHLAFSTHPDALALATGWLRSGLVQPLLVLPDGDTSPSAGRWVRPGELLTW
jgi:hypothetical protein